MQFFTFLRQSIYHRCAEIYPSAYEDYFLKDLNPIPNWKGRFTLEESKNLIIALSLVPIAFPSIFERLKLIWTEYPFAEGAGGRRHAVTGQYIPTVHTALFIIAGSDPVKRLELLNIFFNPSNELFNDAILLPLEENPFKEDPVLQVHPVYLSEKLKIPYSIVQAIESENFPAHLYNTNETWADLYFNEREIEALKEVNSWLNYFQKLHENTNFGKSHKGYKALFYGPPGTGKSVSVGLLGKEIGLPVYRIDLSQIISKWVGETEKNLNRLFTYASSKNWILFFDEGDALFGKRSDKSDGQDQHGNQEISFLLQRLEEYDGIVFLCTNKQANMDEAFKRRFNSRVEFSLPNKDNRKKLWKHYLSDFNLNLSDASLEAIAMAIPVSGASVKNFCKWLFIKKHQMNNTSFSLEELEQLMSSYFYRQENLRIELSLS